MASRNESSLTPSPVRIGWASVDVTPEGPVFLRGQFNARIAKKVRDPLKATALAIESVGPDGHTDAAVMVSCDRAGIEEEVMAGVREKLRQDLPDFDAEKLFISATHTHAAPEVTNTWPEPNEPVRDPAEYLDLLVARIAGAVVEAWQTRSAGAVGWGFGQAVVGHNRRATYFDGSAKMYGNTDDPQFCGIEGYEDHSVDVLFTWDADRRLTGMVVNLACPSQVTESISEVSADFWHEVRGAVADRFGQHVHVLAQCSPAGDQSPHLLVHKEAEARMLEVKGVSERSEIGRRILAAVQDALSAAQKDIRAEVEFMHAVRSVPLTRRQVTPEERDDGQRQVKAYREQLDRLKRDRPDDYRAISVAHRRGLFFGRVEERYLQQQAQSKYPVEVHVLRLGDVVFATNPFELFLDFGLRIKARSRAVQNFLVQLAGNGTYLPTQKAVAGQSYGAGASSNAVGPEGGQELVEGTLKMLNSMWPNQT